MKLDHLDHLVCPETGRSLRLDEPYVLEKGHIAWTGGMADLEANDELQRQFLGV